MKKTGTPATRRKAAIACTVGLLVWLVIAISVLFVIAPMAPYSVSSHITGFVIGVTMLVSLYVAGMWVIFFEVSRWR